MNTTATTDDIVIVPHETVISYALRALMDDYLPDFLEAQHREFFKTDYRNLLKSVLRELGQSPRYVQTVACRRWPRVPAACFDHDWLPDAVINVLREQAAP